jgi:hypothetical protein
MERHVFHVDTFEAPSVSQNPERDLFNVYSWQHGWFPVGFLRVCNAILDTGLRLSKTHNLTVDMRLSC